MSDGTNPSQTQESGDEALKNFKENQEVSAHYPHSPAMGSSEVEEECDWLAEGSFKFQIDVDGHVTQCLLLLLLLLLLLPLLLPLLLHSFPGKQTLKYVCVVNLSQQSGLC